MIEINIEELEQAAKAATPGPWRWEFNAAHKRLHLVGGRPQYDLTIMDFDRWGMGGAVATLRDPSEDGMNIMHRLCDRPDWIAPFAGRAHHASWCSDVTHPDMRLIATANPSTILSLIDRVKKAEAERDALAAKLAELEGQPPVAYANGDALDNMLDDRVCVVLGSKDSFHRTPVFRRQIPAGQPVNARLLGALSALLDDIEGLIGESSGVYGLHLNGDVSPWSELEEGGRFERLSSMSSAREAISAADATQINPQAKGD